MQPYRTLPGADVTGAGGMGAGGIVSVARIASGIGGVVGLSPSLDTSVVTATDIVILPRLVGVIEESVEGAKWSRLAAVRGEGFEVPADSADASCSSL